MRCHFIPPYLLSRLAAADDLVVAECSQATLQVDRQFRARRIEPPPNPATAVATSFAAFGEATINSSTRLLGAASRVTRRHGRRSG